MSANAPAANASTKNNAQALNLVPGFLKNLWAGPKKLSANAPEYVPAAAPAQAGGKKSRKASRKNNANAKVSFPPSHVRKGSRKASRKASRKNNANAKVSFPPSHVRKGSRKASRKNRKATRKSNRK